MNEPVMTEAEALIMAEQCPIIRAAYASGDNTVIARVEKDHPPARCDYVKQAREKEKAK